MRYLLFFILFSVKAQAQYRLSFAAETIFAFKFNLLNNAPDQCRLLADNSLSLGVKIEEDDPDRLSFYGSAGIGIDRLQFPLRINSFRFNIYRYYIPMRGLILFPTRLAALKIMAGIGLDFNMHLGASVYTNDNAGYFRLDVDKVGEDIERMGNSIIPSMQVGAAYELRFGKHKAAVHLLLKQALMKLLNEQYTVPYQIVGEPANININAQPTALGLGLVYFL